MALNFSEIPFILYHRSHLVNFKKIGQIVKWLLLMSILCYAKRNCISRMNVPYIINRIRFQRDIFNKKNSNGILLQFSTGSNTEAIISKLYPGPPFWVLFRFFGYQTCMWRCKHDFNFILDTHILGFQNCTQDRFLGYSSLGQQTWIEKEKHDFRFQYKK
jgi:hypothetical protein